MIDKNGFKLLEATDLTTGYRVATNNNADETIKHVTSTENPHKVTAAQVGASNLSLIDNGDFQVWQRGEVFENCVWATYTADRWHVRHYGDTILNNIQKISNGVRLQCTNAEYFSFIQTIVDFQKWIGKTVTLSASIIMRKGQVSLGLCDHKTLYYPLAITTTTSGIHQTTIHNIPDTIQSLWVQVGNTDLTSKADLDFDIEWIKLEIGENATMHTPLPYGEELALCQRYTTVLKDGEYIRADYINPNYIIFNIPIPTTLRSIPTAAGFKLFNINDVEQSDFTYIIKSHENCISIWATKAVHGLSDAWLYVAPNTIFDAETY